MNPHWTRWINFFRDCFQADSRELLLTNLFKLPEKYRYCFSGEEQLFSGALPRQPIPQKVGLVLQKEKSQYFREKQLIYGCLFVVGEQKLNSGFGRAQKICAPLLYANADIEEDAGDLYLTLGSSVIVNGPLLSELVAQDVDTSAFISQLEQGGFLFSRVALKVEQFLSNHIELRDSLSLLQYPTLADGKSLEEAFKKCSDLQALPSAMVALVDKPKHAEGVVFALEHMVDSLQISPPCQMLFSNYSPLFNRHQWANFNSNRLPVTLSDSQQQALKIAATETLGVVSGPPGTGKSFTIAACIADRILQGEAVLVVSETESALEVIANILKDKFAISDGVVRAGREKYLAELKSLLDDLLSLGVAEVSEQDVCAIETELTNIVREISALEEKFERRAQSSLGRGEWLANFHYNKSSILSGFLAKWASYKTKSDTKHWEILEKAYALETKKDIVAKRYIASQRGLRLSKMLQRSRKQLVRFNQAIRARSSLKQKSCFEGIDHKVLFEAFPVWLVSLSSLHKVLPQGNIFDLVIFDEASQCNIASAIPALQRASRAMIVGDAKQLRHISFISEVKERQIQKANKIDDEDFISYRNTSILDLALQKVPSQDATTLLDEHFRSQSNIIAFSNDMFYRNRLKIMQSRPHTNSTNLEFKSVAGSRDQRGVNREEAEQLLDDVDIYIQSQQTDGFSNSLGILSPYRSQVEFLYQRLYQRFTAEVIDRHRILVGTPYHFQGEERDRMYLSFAVCDNSLRAASYLNKPDVFNVAVTRAKNYQAVYTSVTLEKLHTDNLLRKYVGFSKVNNMYSPPEFRDTFQNDVCDELEVKGATVWKNYPIANENMDILCLFEGRYLAVDLIGFPGQCKDYYSLTTYRVFRRAGLEVLPLSYGVWCEFRSQCLDAIWSALNPIP